MFRLLHNFLSHFGVFVDRGLHVGNVPEDAPCLSVLHREAVVRHHGGRRAEARLLELRDQVEPDGHLVRAIVVGHSRMKA